MTDNKYNRSASEGNLADCEDEEFEYRTPAFEDKLAQQTKLVQPFSTLPRRITSRKKFKRKQLKEKYEPRTEKQKPPKKIPKSASTDGFFTRLFRSLGAFGSRSSSEGNYQAVVAQPVAPSDESNTSASNIVDTGNLNTSSNTQAVFKVPRNRSRLISASNNDIRTSHPPIQSESLVTPTEITTREKPPALCGLRNHGNTCFMNAIIQCLNNTDPFAEYFVLDQYKVDLNRHSKIHAKKFGTKGEVTEQLASLLKSLWSCQYTQEISSKFKSLVAKYGNQYEGSRQHDAQEFLLWLLDKVHEDLNIATKKKYKKPKSPHGRPDTDVAAEVLSNYRRCNNSFVQDIFQAQFRSSLSCPSCGKQSNTFDPYLCISLPIPHDAQRRTIAVILVRYQSTTLHESLHSYILDTEATLKELREKLSLDSGVPEQQLILTEMGKDGFQQSFSILDPVSFVTGGQICAIEMPTVPSAEHNGEHVTLVWINQVRDEVKTENFGPLFVMPILRESTYEEMQRMLLENMAVMLKKNIPMEDLGVLFKLRVQNSFSPVRCYIPNDVQHPLYTTCVEEALAPFATGGELEQELCGPPHLKVVIEWDKDTKLTLIRAIDDKVIEEEDLPLEKESKTAQASLLQCFELYFMEEKLGIEDAWMCPSCRCHQQGTKKLSLWSAPDVFIVHLKRFRQQSSTQRTKLTTDVSFPLTGLDISPFVSLRTYSSSNQEATQLLASSTLTALSSWSPWRRHRTNNHYERHDETYDLYAVCNHHGSMQGGHYTAYAKNPVDSRWYLYDDLKVKGPIQESEVVTPDAYILFYQRGSLSSSGSTCSTSSSSGYSTASMVSLMNSEHWSNRMPPFHHWPAKGSQSQDNLCDPDGSKTPRLNSNRPFERSQRAYSSLMPKTDPPKSLSSELERHSDDESSIHSPSSQPDSRYKTLPSQLSKGTCSSEAPSPTSEILPTNQNLARGSSSPTPKLKSPTTAPSSPMLDSRLCSDESQKYWTITSV